MVTLHTYQGRCPSLLIFRRSTLKHWSRYLTCSTGSGADVAVPENQVMKHSDNAFLNGGSDDRAGEKAERPKKFDAKIWSECANVTVTKNTRQKKSRTPTFTSATDALFLVCPLDRHNKTSKEASKELYGLWGRESQRVPTLLLLRLRHQPVHYLIPPEF